MPNARWTGWPSSPLAGGAILAGPWTGEVGFELLYWIPFIRWFAAEYEVDTSRLIVLSRGGTESWYSPLGSRYLDAFDLGTPEEFRHHVAGGNKQQTVRTFDRVLLRRARQQLRVPVGLLYPALMYHLLMPFWQGQMGSGWAARFGRYVRYDPPPLDDLAQKLPEQYVAVRFYHSACFPDTARTRAFVRRTLEALTASEEVVLIAPGTLVDDHRDALVDGLPQIHVVSDLAVARNLAIQTAIISRARRFVGTYGGLSYLAPLCGVPAIAFYAVRNFRHHHLIMASEVAERIGGATLTVIDVADVDSPPVRLEFVVRPPLGAGPSPGSGKPNGHCLVRHGPPCGRRRRSTANGVWPFNDAWLRTSL